MKNKRTTPIVVRNTGTSESIFSVKFWKFKLNDDDTDRLKIINETYVLQKINPKGIQRSNSGGWHSSNDFYKNPVFDKLNSKIFNIIETEILPREYSLLNNIYKGIESEHTVTKLSMDSGWVNINKRSDYNVVHTHEDAFLSVVFYLKIPSSGYRGDFTFKDPISVRKHQGQIYGKINDYIITPEDGLLVVFPSWMPHQVRAHNQDEDRISFSCNIRYPYVDKIGVK